MLKIKDNVELEILKEFGFKQKTETSLACTPIYGYYKILDFDGELDAENLSYIFIDQNLRMIDILSMYDDMPEELNIDEFTNVIFDLMDAGLVEKMEK